MSPDEIRSVLRFVTASGHGEWLDRTQYLVLYNSAAELGTAIYAWAVDTGKIGDVYTVYDVYADDGSADQIFHQVHPRAIMKALAHLQLEGKAQISKDDAKPVDEWGVKFLEL